ncbi:MAG: hypothetical protein GC203_10675 [Phenylobacterium sp.]|uniref:YfbU family protein n=1 Tax=Phenylobacterium sp. TaxID=1871053 RepID=UPI0025D91BEC|nr:YfbU family protein [Phenylobacterium sp.]MBI1198315.1 hypothetical protein [Phenylobacterium sp.]
MPPKSERFELRLEQDTLDRVDAWRREQGDLPSRAEAIRRLVETGLNAATSSRRLDISNVEKLMLYLLCDIHEKVEADRELDPKLIRRALLYGHTWGLEMEYGNFFPTVGDNRDIKSEVVDMLDMFNFVEAAVDRLGDEDRKRLEAAVGHLDLARFTGFDGNHEIEHASVMSFLVEDMGRFSRFKDRAHLNSHSESLTRYRRMLAAFEPIRPRLAGRELNLSELIEIIEARRLRSSVDA